MSATPEGTPNIKKVKGWADPALGSPGYPIRPFVTGDDAYSQSKHTVVEPASLVGDAIALAGAFIVGIVCTLIFQWLYYYRWPLPPCDRFGKPIERRVFDEPPSRWQTVLDLYTFPVPAYAILAVLTCRSLISKSNSLFVYVPLGVLYTVALSLSR